MSRGRKSNFTPEYTNAARPKKSLAFAQWPQKDPPADHWPSVDTPLCLEGSKKRYAFCGTMPCGPDLGVLLVEWENRMNPAPGHRYWITASNIYYCD